MPPRITQLTVLVGLATALLACSSSQPRTELDQWEREVRILYPGQLTGREYETIAGMEETETIVGMGEDTAVNTATHRLKRRAAKLDADAVVIVSCGRQRSPSDPVRSQLPTVLCKGVAIRWVEPAN
ncbi:MAG: hypothetical protein ACC742_09900 [Thermoanaerobaculales bacterium]